MPRQTLFLKLYFLLLVLLFVGYGVLIGGALWLFDFSHPAHLTRFLVFGLCIVFISCLCGYLVFKKLSLPLQNIKSAVDNLSRGDFNVRINESSTRDIEEISNLLNLTAEHLDERIKALVRNKNEQEAMLSCLVEGVLAIDPDENVLSMNGAAKRLLGISEDLDPSHKSIQEILRNADLQNFVKQSLNRGGALEANIVLHAGGERFINTYSRALKGASGNTIGVLIVLHDVTRLRQLENIRRDFVANVSHELKTPITSIQGFVETLLDGAMHEPNDARRFLNIILRQAERLNSIFQDLLLLSKMEDEREKHSVQFEVHSLREVITQAIENCERKAEDKDIVIHMPRGEDVQARVNTSLLEQAFVNLIDNAIKYSDSGSPITIDVETEGELAVVRIKDRGVGIESIHLPRLFERFYRVDAGRSRKLGGTGLGLAIVKHIIQIHSGFVEVDSRPGEGTTFTIRLPLNEKTSYKNARADNADPS